MKDTQDKIRYMNGSYTLIDVVDNVATIGYFDSEGDHVFTITFDERLLKDVEYIDGVKLLVDITARLSPLTMLRQFDK